MGSSVRKHTCNQSLNEIPVPLVSRKRQRTYRTPHHPKNADTRGLRLPRVQMVGSSARMARRTIHWKALLRKDHPSSQNPRVEQVAHHPPQRQITIRVHTATWCGKQLRQKTSEASTQAAQLHGTLYGIDCRTKNMTAPQNSGSATGSQKHMPCMIRKNNVMDLQTRHEYGIADLQPLGQDEHFKV